MTQHILSQENPRALTVLARARREIDPLMRAAVDELPRSMRRVTGFHLGWWNQFEVPEEGAPGKALRPALVMASARALGDDSGACAAAAAAIELLHNFTLVHDDVMDADTTRRHRPTAWSVFGTTDAILAGAALHTLALMVLARDEHAAAPPAAGRLTTCLIELYEGQSADCRFETRNDVGLAETMAMAEAKTGALLGAACAIGALYAGASDDVATSLDRFGRELGLGYRLIDDLLGIWGDPAVTGKPAGSDLISMKKSLPVVAALSSNTPAGALLAERYASGASVREREVTWIAGLVELAGGREWARAEATRRVRLALDLLATTCPDEAAAADLMALTRLVTRRQS
ncbi:polyprenyl synthetase family protein [Streptomyces sp. NPDC058701]|uniref:polyprenyl synthetase family protein n=1 Tax=Streptomyces sp. NPDC058701 TaxID=3346608 RepID=UPI0036613704